MYGVFFFFSKYLGQGAQMPGLGTLPSQSQQKMVIDHKPCSQINILNLVSKYRPLGDGPRFTYLYSLVNTIHVTCATHLELLSIAQTVRKLISTAYHIAYYPIMFRSEVIRAVNILYVFWQRGTDVSEEPASRPIP